MPLNVGDRLGHYDVTALIGEGGMGQVYRATDTKLGRQVALKILPDAFATDRDRLARSQREAEVLASLNHPAIAAIHGIEESEGTRALVLELVEGPTLADRIAHGPIPVDDALRIATQIAEALEAAHDAGVIHRDLKPANIKVKTDGAVKVLDFGLAKALDPVAADTPADPSQSPTLTAVATRMGVIMGTAAYMSPEQARGRPVDRRADLWAFGCVLYEMLTATRAFEGEDVSMTLSKVLQRDPDFDALPPETPPRVRTVLQACLQKDTRHRIGDAHDVRLALEGAFETVVSPVTDARPAPHAAWRRVLPYVAAVLAVAVGVVAGRALSRPPGVSPADPVRLSVALRDGIRYVNTSSPSHGLAVSPDGSHVVFRGRRNDAVDDVLYRRSLDDLSVVEIPGTEGGQQPFFSPDGTTVAFVADGALKRVGLDGRPPVTLADGLSFGSVGVWSGDEIFYTTPGGRSWRVPAAGGTPTSVVAVEQSADPLGSLAVVAGTGDLLHGRGFDSAPRVELVSPESGVVTPVLGDAQLVGHTASGHLLVERDGVLLAAAFDGPMRRVGPVVPVLDGFSYDIGGRRPQIAVSPSGTLAYVPERARRVETLAWVEANGALTPVGELPARSSTVDLTADGRLAVLGLLTVPRRAVLWDMVRHVPAGLDVEGDLPRWHPDGRHIALSRPGELLLVDVDDGSETTLATVEGARNASFTADGETVVFTAIGESGTSDVFALLPGETTPRAMVATGLQEHSPAVSPDGRWVAYVESPAGFAAGAAVYIARFPSGTGRRRVTAEDGNQPWWRQDSRALFFYERVADADSVETLRIAFRVVEIGPGDTLDMGTPRSLFDVVGPELPLISQTFSNVGAAYAASPDGDRFLMVFQPRPAPLTEIVIVQNWLTELDRLVPAS